jgi:hypothetical protein
VRSPRRITGRRRAASPGAPAVRWSAEGAIFFGAERLVTGERWADTADHIVLICRVTAIDATGAPGSQPRRPAAEVNSRCWVRRGATASRWWLAAPSPIRRRVTGSPMPTRRSSGPSGCSGRETASPQIPLERFAHGAGLDGGEIDARQARRRARSGETLFREAEPGGISVARAGRYRSRSAGRRASRIVTFAPGSIFGEAALLDGGKRSATAVVDEDAVVYSLSRAGLERLGLIHPALANKLLLNLGRHLSGRLRQTTDALRELSDGPG